uniref:Uncharacterized protein n=1 Tax=Oryza glumipatula TaxID=40148 RepID=A0A0E0BTT2_9ORYZ
MAKKKKVFIFRKAADVAMAVSAAYAPFAAAVSYHAAAAAPAALAFALGHGALLFMLPFSDHMDPYPTIDGVLQLNPAAAWCALLAPVALVLFGLVKASAATAGAGDVGTFATVIAGAFWAMDAGAAVLLGWVIAGEIAMARETGKRSIYRSSSSEIASALLMVWVRYFVYLHVFHLIACGGHLTWFNSSLA